MKLDQSSFLRKYRLHEEALELTGLRWPDLQEIYKDHKSRFSVLERPAQFVTSQLRLLPPVHSLRYRIKDAEHLIAKIIRKAQERSIPVPLEDYRAHIHDLVGIRALHLFKHDWAPIHDFLTGVKWPLAERPQANVRNGDPEEVIRSFEAKGCAINTHPRGYRSVHYLFRIDTGEGEQIVELQVRTLFEEAWSEIDHRFHYPYGSKQEVVAQFLAIFNRLAGYADVMGSYVATLDDDLAQREAAHDASKRELQRYIKRLNISENQMRELEQRLEKLETNRPERVPVNKAQEREIISAFEALRKSALLKAPAIQMASLDALVKSSQQSYKLYEDMVKQFTSPAEDLIRQQELIRQAIAPSKAMLEAIRVAKESIEAARKHGAPGMWDKMDTKENDEDA